MKKIAIVVVDFNRHQDTIDFLDSARGLNTAGFDLKTIVVDNGSEKGLPGAIEKKYQSLRVELLQTGANKGFAGGYNFGMKYALAWGADYLLVVNNDTLFGDKNLIKKLQKVIESDKRIGLVSPKIYFAKGFEFHKSRYRVKDKGKVIWYAGGSFDEDNVLAVHRGVDEVDKGLYDEIEETGFASGCCFLVRTSVLNKIGFFEEGLFAYFEDLDFMIRAQEAGYKLYYCGGTYLYHKVSQTTGIGSPLSDYLLTRNRLYVGMKYLSLRIKFALLRQAFYLLRTGRKEQKMAVRDFLKRKTGPPPWVSQNSGSKKYSLELSIVIVNYKTASLTLKLLETIYNSKSGFDTKRSEVIVLDNASGDGIGSVIKKNFPQAKLIQNRINTGFAGGYNKAISFSKGEYILMLNSDIEVLPGSISAMLTEAKKQKNKAVIVSKLFFTDGMIQDSCFKLPTVAGAIKEYFFNQKGEYEMYYPKASTFSAVEGAVMASYLIPREVWNKVGKLSEDSFMYFEDVEYCRRLKRANLKIYYYPKAGFIHHHGASSKKIGDKAHDYLKKGAILYHGRIKYLLLWLILWLAQKIKVVGSVSKQG